MERSKKRKRRKAVLRAKRVAAFLAVALLVAVGVACMKNDASSVGKDDIADALESNSTQESYAEGDLGAVTTVMPSESVDYLSYGDPDNYIYPFNTMSADWGSEVYEEGFRYYEIPEEYAREGGCFPEVVQVYLWCLCKERDIDYYMVVALIERESDYKWDAVGDGGNSLGYMQIGQKWHEERMLEEGVADLLNPYGNIRVGLNFIQELNDRYLESSGANCVLMVYNMGESQAKSWWAKGVYSTEYSRGILARAEEIKQELEQV